MTKAKRLILDGVRDHIVSHIMTNNTTKEMWDVIASLYQNPSKQQNMFLKEKLRNIRIQKGEGIDPFLTRIHYIRDELATIREEPQAIELMHLSLNNVIEE